MQDRVINIGAGGYETLTGTFLGEIRNMSVTVQSASTTSFTFKTNPRNFGTNVYTNYYSDIEMGQAGYELGVVMSLEQFRKTYPNYRKSEYALGHAAIEIRCAGAKNGMSPDHVKP